MTGTGSTEPAVAAAGDLRRRQGETVLITGASSGIGRETGHAVRRRWRGACARRARRGQIA